MEMTLQWYFSVGILGFCAVAMAMRLGARARRSPHSSSHGVKGIKQVGPMAGGTFQSSRQRLVLLLSPS
jgi:hypothetical protein